MFTKETYTQRRQKLTERMKNQGLLLFLGNTDIPFNYPSNTYAFRQDSTFLYLFGIKQPNLAGVIDTDTGEDYLFGNDVEIDDIIWMGEQPTIKQYTEQNGVQHPRPLDDLKKILAQALVKGRSVHYLAPYRAKTRLQLQELLGIPAAKQNEKSSETLTRQIIALRSYKEPCEIKEIEGAIDTAYLMHTTAMKMAVPGVKEQAIYGKMEGIALAHGGPVSFPVILSVNGQILHNHHHPNTLKEGDLLLADAGCESAMHYCSDITRTTPVGGTFTQKQKEIYQAVLDANKEVIKQSKPGVYYKDMHLLSAKIVAEGLKAVGIMKGDVEEAVTAGAHALFYPHGLGHMMGMDVHDMEGLGENFVGYDEETSRSEEFGLAFLRMGKQLREGFVLTVEPGIYFIPALIDLWQKDKKHAEFINYKKVEEYRSFGGIRIEDDILITQDGCRVLGTPIPKEPKDLEAMVGTPLEV